MIGTGYLVAESDVGARAKKKRAVAGHLVLEPVVAVCHDLHVLRGERLCFGEHLLIAVADDYLAVIGPTPRSDFGRRQDFQQALALGHRVAREFLAVGDQNRGRGWAVLGLAEQIRRTDLAVSSLVGDEEGLGRSRE